MGGYEGRGGAANSAGGGRAPHVRARPGVCGDDRAAKWRAAIVDSGRAARGSGGCMRRAASTSRAAGYWFPLNARHSARAVRALP